MADWNIRPRATQCSLCGKAFEPASTGYSYLTTTGELYERKDLCADCFKSNPPRKDALTSAGWSFTIPKANSRATRKEATVQKETAIQLLRKLVTRARPEDVEAIYILAILLERNKQFIERDLLTQPDGKTIRLYEFKPTGEVFPIEAPLIQADALPAVQQRVIALLEGRDETPEVEPPTPRPHANVKRATRNRHPKHLVKRIRRVR